MFFNEMSCIKSKILIQSSLKQLEEELDYSFFNMVIGIPPNFEALNPMNNL
jgi:hypothetical protein